MEDLLLNEDVKLDWMFKSSLLLDLIKVGWREGERGRGRKRGKEGMDVQVISTIRPY